MHEDLKKNQAIFDEVLKKASELRWHKYQCYGNSYKKFGLIGIAIKINDKCERLINVLQNKQLNKLITDETLQDTAIDLINYATDISGNGNNGVLTSFTSTTTAIGVIGQALEFDGVLSRIVVSDPDGRFGNSDELTLAVWVKMDIVATSPATGRVIIGRRNGEDKYVLDRLDALNRARMEYRNADPFITSTVVSADDSFPLGEWIHIVTTLKADDTIQLYIQGEASGSSNTFTESLDNTAQDLIIGFATGNNTGMFMDGLLDDVRIYDRALSADEISRLYDLGK